MATHLTAREAATLLGVTLPTIYAYTSRGLLRSERMPGKTRARRYLREDVERLVARQKMRRDPGKAVEQGLNCGAPVLDSALTLIEGGTLFYRGRNVLELARRASVEEVAALLWQNDTAAAKTLFAADSAPLPPGLPTVLKSAGHLGPIERCQLALTFAAAADASGYDFRPESVAATGVRILRLLTTVVAAQTPRAFDRSSRASSRKDKRKLAPSNVEGRLRSGEPLRVHSGEPVERVLRTAWAPSRPELEAPIRAALILCADHELNVSAFTGRCVASAGATPYDVVLAGLAALKGTRHGGETARVEALFREVTSAVGLRSGQAARDVVSRRLQRGERLPGFGHPLYPDGDPRAAALLAIAKKAAPRSPDLALAEALLTAVADLIGDRPTLDLGLVTLAHTLRLPPNSPIAIFGLGRTIGWIGHAMEQYRVDRIIRPRARYVGDLPDHTGSGS